MSNKITMCHSLENYSGPPPLLAAEYQWKEYNDYSAMAQDWSFVVQRSFSSFADSWTAQRFIEEYASQQEFEKLFMVCLADTKQPIATCFCWRESQDPFVGKLHWLAVVPEHRGFAFRCFTDCRATCTVNDPTSINCDPYLLL